MFYLSTLAPLNVVPQRFPVQAPHFVFDYIQPELERLFGKDALLQDGLRVTTTLDLDLQQKAQVALEKWISEFEASASGHNGALVAIDPKTSEVLVMVGSRDYFRDDIEGRNNNALAGNSPGSTLKPFAYAAAFENLNWGTETEILDTPVSFPDGDNVFTPRNPSGNFQGPISVRKALGNSLNIPAVKTAAYVGIPNVLAEYQKFGLTGHNQTPLDGVYGPAIVVGGIDVNLLSVAYGYSVFANNGVLRGVKTTQTLPDGYATLAPVSILQVVREDDGEILYPSTDDHRVKVQEERVLDAKHAYMINDILSDPNAFCITYGCGALSIGREWGVKTGTSEPFENSRAIGETWTYGYTPDLVAGVWAGNADNSPMYNITSTSISYRALRDFMVEALADVPARQFERPSGLKEVETCTPSGLKATAQCGRKVKQLLPEDLKLKDDDWWKRARIDIRDGLLATELTPPQYVQERFGLAIPTSVEGFARQQAEEWSRFLNLAGTPTEESSGAAPVRIDSPKQGAYLKNKVKITGKAVSEKFLGYRVEVGAGAPPFEWEVLASSLTPETGGELAEWDVSDLPDGIYTIRLVLVDADRGELTTFILVNVGENVRRNPTPVPTNTPDFDFGGAN
jgi:membrane peptidoglycan carboxypeptidase